MGITPVVLLILDGFGYRQETADNAIAQARTPHLDHFYQHYPHTLIHASEHFVGLPAGQMGNSEVGHLNIGAGRVVNQDFDRINQSISSGAFSHHPIALEAIHLAQRHQRALHILGLISDGGVHSHQDHIHAMIELAAQQGLQQIYVHAFLDGRDTPPISASGYLQALQKVVDSTGVASIASICGRYYAMDRDQRWERILPAYRLLSEGHGSFQASTALEGLQMAYQRGENDEFVQATAISAQGPSPHIQAGDVVVFMNFRSDRARQLTRCLLEADFSAFPRPQWQPLGGYYSLTSYDKTLSQVKVLFPPFAVPNTFGEFVSAQGCQQLRIAETEKYPHVTFFFNGGEETVFPGEDRILVPSPKVATYDLQPEMSAFEVTQHLEQAILSGRYQAIICNFANCDMVGHTGILSAAVQAVEAIDTCLGRVVAAAQQAGAEVLITADHGNAELMLDHANQQPHTQHTTNLVPLIYIGRPAQLRSDGALSDIAPSLLHMMGLPQPAEMTGKALMEFTAA